MVRPKNLYISSVDFRKAVDRRTLLRIVREYGVDQKTVNLIKLILLNTKYKVKFPSKETKKNHIKVSSLTFADDLVLLAETEEEAISQINTLKETAGKTGLQLSYEKTEFMTMETNYGKKVIETKYGRTRVTKTFKYLGETICNNGLEKERIKEKIIKLERLNFATGNTYNKKNLSSNTK
ncbi:uncharacterized protein [Halyomorpha halys]|uniref:uncharacterized protein n=1 Tax=Halyomorpha halys TaxID=286706 RepID=UPI0006D4D3CA